MRAIAIWPARLCKKFQNRLNPSGSDPKGGSCPQSRGGLARCCLVDTGENLNEHILASHWPPVHIRQEMLTEAGKLIRALRRGGVNNYTPL
jgi:hypothetical protein